MAGCVWGCGCCGLGGRFANRFLRSRRSIAILCSRLLLAAALSVGAAVFTVFVFCFCGAVGGVAFSSLRPVFIAAVMAALIDKGALVCVVVLLWLVWLSVVCLERWLLAIGFARLAVDCLAVACLAGCPVFGSSSLKKAAVLLPWWYSKWSLAQVVLCLFVRLGEPSSALRLRFLRLFVDIVFGLACFGWKRA